MKPALREIEMDGIARGTIMVRQRYEQPSQLWHVARIEEHRPAGRFDLAEKRRRGQDAGSLDQLDTCPGKGQTLASEAASGRPFTVLARSIDRQVTRFLA